MNANRMNWLDAARIAAAFGIVGIHTTTDSKGNAFLDYEVSERIFPSLMRVVSELANTEFFILISLFLLAFKLERTPMTYLTTIKYQARRLLIPFAFWTIFYVFYSLVKANVYGYFDPVLAKLALSKTWFDYFLLGTSQYHLHFIPTLFLIFLFHPVFKLALKTPMIGVIVIPFLIINHHMTSWLWGNITDKTTLEYLVRIVKIMTYLGYGFAAYSFLGLWQKKFDKELSQQIFLFGLVMISLLFIIKLTHAAENIETGLYMPKIGMNFYAHALLPISLFLIFLGSQHFNWPEGINRWSKYTFGIYLIHPAVIETVGIFVRKYFELAPYQYVILKYIATVSIVLLIAIIISKISYMAWTIGLGPLPFEKTKSPITDTESTSDSKLIDKNVILNS